MCSNTEEGDGVARTSVSGASPDSKLEIDTDADTKRSQSDSDSCDGNTHSESAICLSQCCKDSEVLTVYQTKDKVVLSGTKKQQGNRSRQFRSDWYDFVPMVCTMCDKIEGILCLVYTLCEEKIIDRSIR